MANIGCCAIAIVRQCAYDDSDATRSIALVDDLFDFCRVLIESGSSLDGAVDDIRRDTVFFRGVYRIGEGIVLSWVGSLLCGERDELGVESVYFCLCLGIFIFLGGYGWSASHRLR